MTAAETESGGMFARPRFIGSGIYRTSGYGAGQPLAIARVATVIDLCRALPPQVLAA